MHIKKTCFMMCCFFFMMCCTISIAEDTGVQIAVTQEEESQNAQVNSSEKVAEFTVSVEAEDLPQEEPFQEELPREEISQEETSLEGNSEDDMCDDSTDPQDVVAEYSIVDETTLQCCYARVKGGTVVYRDLVAEEMLGIFNDEAIVCVSKVDLEDCQTDEVVKVLFDTEARFNVDSEVYVGYVIRENIWKVEDDEILAMLQNGARIGRSVECGPLPLAEFDECETKVEIEEESQSKETDIIGVEVPSKQDSLLSEIEIKAPENLTAVIASESSVRLEWDAVTGATGYRLYRADGDRDYQLIKSVLTNSTVTYSLNPEIQYHFKIAAIHSEGSTTQKSDYSNVVDLKITVPDAPKWIQGEQIAIDALKLSWAEVEGAVEYRIYRSVNNGAFTLLKSVNTTNTATYGIDLSANTYSYRVAAVTSDAGVIIRGSYSKTIDLVEAVNAPTILDVKKTGNNKATIIWNEVEGATAYRLYRSVNGDIFTLVKTVDSTTTENFNLDFDNDRYGYKVIAIKQEDEILLKSDYSDPFFLVTRLDPPQNLSVQKESSSIAILTWEPVEYATGYRVYRATEDGEYSLVKTVAEATTKNYGLNQSTNYKYRIAAVSQVGSVIVKSDYSNESVLYNTLSPVKDITILYNTTSSVDLTWNAVDGATAYRIYKRERDAAKTLVKTVSTPYTTTYGLSVGDIYGFCVKPIREDGTVTLDGPESQEEQYFHIPPITTTYTQNYANIVHISWNAVDGATEYEIYQLAEDKKTKLCTTNELSKDINITADDILVFEIVAKFEDYASQGNVIVVTNVVTESTLQWSIAQVLDSNKVSLAWEPLQNILYYEIKRTQLETGSVEMITTKDTTLLDDYLLPNTEYEYSYKAVYQYNDAIIQGNWSQSILLRTLPTPVYRALLIGEEHYSEILEGTKNDVDAMCGVLSTLESMHWEKYTQMDASAQELIDLISIVFSGATDNDISLFYYSGHGVMNSGTYYSGALMTANYDYVTIKDLAEVLSTIPGKVIVILDSCGSGAAIKESTLFGNAKRSDIDRNFEFDPNKFNEQAIDIFAMLDSKALSKSGEFRVPKFMVLTASAYEQESKTINRGGIWGGVFTRGVTESVGYDYETGAWSDDMYGDVNNDHVLTLHECYVYSSDFAMDYQNVQEYPTNCNQALFFKP